MNESRTFRDEASGGPSRPPLGAELLPPVEEPSAKFIIQLFVVPALIVAGIVGLWLAFSWLVRSTSLGPEKLIAGVDQGPSVARWQRASELADILHDKRYANFKRDHNSATQLAQILNREIDQSKDGNDSEQAAYLRFFLTRALGEFEVEEGADALLKAAETKRTPNDDLVRRGALEALAVRIYNLGQHDPPEQLHAPEVEATLVRMTEDQDPTIRLRAAYALGKLGTPAALERLEVLTDDPDADTRFNSAIALAHRGNAKSVDTLAEIFDVDELVQTTTDKDGNTVPSKLIVFIEPAMGAVQSLAHKNTSADLGPIVASLEKLSKADEAKLKAALVPPRFSADAQQCLDMLKSLK